MVRVREKRKFFSKPSLTRQEFKDECDIQTLIRRFGRTQEGLDALLDVQRSTERAQFGDVSAIPSYQAVNNMLIDSKASFMRLPHEVRARFNNDPVSFVDFVSNPENLDECRKLGLAKPLEAVSDVSSDVKSEVKIEPQK